MALSHVGGPMESWTKAQASPVTEVDIKLDTYLNGALRTARPAYGWLSEESPDDLSRLTARRSFVVDPIDGTRGFMKGEDSWTVTAAVIENGVALAGVVYAPVRDELIEAAAGGGVSVNGVRLDPPQRGLTARPRIAGPPVVHEALVAAVFPYQRVQGTVSLAYRLTLVARGLAEVALVRPGAEDWDIAGAMAILTEMGIEPSDACTGALQLNGPTTRHGPLAVCADPLLKARLVGVLRDVYPCPDAITT